MTTQDDRAAFEAEFSNHKLDKHSIGECEYKFKYVQHAWEGWQAALAHERQLKPVQADDVRYVTQIAVYMHDKFFKAKSPIFEPLDTVDGILSQIDNMVCGIPAISNKDEAVAWRWKHKDSNIWIYNPDIDWLNSRNDVDKEPLFTAPPQPQSGEAIYQVGVGGMWTDSSKDYYDQCKVSPRRIVYAAPPQSQSVKDALEAAAKIAEDATKRTQFQTIEHYKIAAFISKHIRALITDKKEG